jgi:hypothetical protein
MGMILVSGEKKSSEDRSEKAMEGKQQSTSSWGETASTLFVLFALGKTTRRRAAKGRGKCWVASERRAQR